MPVRPSNCPDVETLAAFIDGRLTSTERQRVFDHLDGCAACRELVAESAAVLEDLEEPATSDRSFWRRPRRWLYTALPLAASLLLVAVFWRGPGVSRSGALSSAELVDGWAKRGELPTGLEPGWQDPLWSVYLGEGDNPDPRVAFRLGAEILSLRVAVEAGGPSELSRGILGSVRRELEDAEVAEFFPELDALEAALAEGASPEPALAALTTLETTLADPDGFIRPSQRFDLGRWAQAGRLAALAGDRDFFERRRIRRLPEELLEADRAARSGFELTPGEKRLLGDLAMKLDDRVGRRDLPALRRSFEELLRAAG